MWDCSCDPSWVSKMKQKILWSTGNLFSFLWLFWSKQGQNMLHTSIGFRRGFSFHCEHFLENSFISLCYKVTSYLQLLRMLCFFQNFDHFLSKNTNMWMYFEFICQFLRDPYQSSPFFETSNFKKITKTQIEKGLFCLVYFIFKIQLFVQFLVLSKR